MLRTDNRAANTLRPWRFETNYLPHAEGSVMIHCGVTRVLCACSVEERQPVWMGNDGKRGWVKAEYAMLPRATHQRSRRDFNNSNGRTHEIQRLIGRSLRGVTDLNALGPRTLTVDCDVIVADAGTRTASITGGWVALVLACSKLIELGKLQSLPFTQQVAAVSLGIVDGQVLTDLDYPEDSRAGTDLNLVMNSSGGLIEIQGTAEGGSFSRQELDTVLDAGWVALEQLFALQRQALEQAGVHWNRAPA
jgi:ribonuclease PH